MKICINGANDTQNVENQNDDQNKQKYLKYKILTTLFLEKKLKSWDENLNNEENIYLSNIYKKN